MSIIFNYLTRNVAGNLPAIVGPPTGNSYYSQGLLLSEDGEVWVSLDAIDYYNQGLPFTALDELCVEDAPATRYTQGLGFTANGRLSATNMAGTDHYNQGIGVTSPGGIVLAIELSPDSPTQVENLVLTTPLDNQVTATWDAVVSVPAVTSYTIEYKESTSGTWIPVNVGLDLTHDITGLLADIQYDVRVKATNINGDGPYSVIAQIVTTGIPLTLPPQVMNLVLTLPSDNNLRGSWDAVVVDPPATGYSVEYKADTSPTWILGNVGLSLDAEIGGLLSGVNYEMRIYATNINGAGPPSDIEQLVVEGIPEQITVFNVVAAIEQAACSWDAPTASPSITSYSFQLRRDVDSIWLPFVDFGFVTSTTIFALSSELWDFRVSAINSRGMGLYSAVVQATPTSIVAALVGLYNEAGISTSNPVTFNNNQGTAGSNWDCDVVLGTGSAITPQTRKDKACWQVSSADAGLSASSASTSFAQPFAIVSCQTIFFGAASPSRILIRGAQADQTYRTNEIGMWSGVNLDITNTLQTGTESILVSNSNGGSSLVRVLENSGSVDITLAGDGGTNPFLMEALAWQNSQSASRSGQAQFYEHRVYDGELSSPEIDSVIGALQQKWWNGFPYIVPAPVELALMVYDETGLVSAGQGLPITAWNNTGSSAGQNDYTVVDGIGNNIFLTIQNGVNVPFSNGSVALDSVNAQAGLAGPYTIYLAGIQSVQNAEIRYWFSGSGNNVNCRVNNADHHWWCGNPLISNVNGQNSNVILAMICDGGSSRYVGNGAVSFDVSGNAGTNAYQVESIFANNAADVSTAFVGSIFEKRVYDSAHSTSQIDDVVQELATKFNISI